MSSVPGPLIRFVIDQPGLSQAVEPAMRQLKNDAQRASKQIADSWRTTAAQIRADMSRGVLSTKQLGDAQRGLVSSLQSQIAALRQRNELTSKELSSLKAMTLELERQKNALKTGSGVGITRGTEHALSQVGTQQMLGITRMFDALVNRYFGGAAGSAVRTLRDTAYYSSMAAEGGAGSSGSTSILGKLFTPGGLAAAGGIAGLTLAAAAITKMSIAGGKLAVELTNAANKTGMTASEVIKLQAVSNVLGVDFDRVQTGFRKFDQEITLASSASLPNATQKAKEAADMFRILGVDVKQAAADPFSAIQQLSRALSVLPDGATKTAVAVELFGRGGMELLPVLDRMPGALNATKDGTDALVRALTGGAVKSMEDLTGKVENFKLQLDAVEVSLAQNVLPTLGRLVDLLNRGFAAWNLPDTVRQYNEMFHGTNYAKGDYGSSIRRPNLSGISAGLGNVTVNMKSLPSAADEASAKLKELAGVLGTTGKAAKGAASRVASSPYTRSLPGNYINYHGTFTAGPAPDILPPLTDVQLPGVGSLNALIEKEQLAAQAVVNSNKAFAEAQKKAAEEIQRQVEEYKKQADTLFGDLVHGKAGQFSKQFEDDVEAIVLKPFENQFENLIGGLLYGLNKSINGGPGSSSSGFSGLMGRVFGGGGLFGPGGTPGTFAGSLGLGGGSRGGTVAVGQLGAQTQTMYVSAGRVIISGSSSGGSALGMPGASGFLGGGGFGTFFGNLNPFGGGNSFFGNLSPFGKLFSFGGAFSGFPGALNGQAGPLASGLLLGVLGGEHGNTTQQAMGAATTASALIRALGGSSTLLKNPNGSYTTALGKIGGALPGFGMVGAGIAQGGGSGALMDMAGGAEAGLAIGGPVGAAIGAAIGGIVGGIRAIFGGKGWNYNVRKAMSRQAIYLPPSENFSFASLPGQSISQTMGTGFGMVGNTGVAYALPSNTPFTANPIYGPLNNYQKQQLNQWYYGLNTNEPFFGAGASPYNPGNPFTGNFNGWNGRAFPTSSPLQVHINLPAYVDASTAEAALAPHAESIARLVSSKLGSGSTGFMTAARRAVALP